MQFLPWNIYYKLYETENGLKWWRQLVDSLFIVNKRYVFYNFQIWCFQKGVGSGTRSGSGTGCGSGTGSGSKLFTLDPGSGSERGLA